MAKLPATQSHVFTPPPDLPAIPDLNERLADYLRRLALWANGNFNDCLSLRTATGELFMRSASGATVWSITIDDSGVLQTKQLTPGARP